MDELVPSDCAAVTVEMQEPGQQHVEQGLGAEQAGSSQAVARDDGEADGGSPVGVPKCQ